MLKEVSSWCIRYVVAISPISLSYDSQLMTILSVDRSASFLGRFSFVDLFCLDLWRSCEHLNLYMCQLCKYISTDLVLNDYQRNYTSLATIAGISLVWQFSEENMYILWLAVSLKQLSPLMDENMCSKKIFKVQLSKFSCSFSFSEIVCSGPD